MNRITIAVGLMIVVAGVAMAQTEPAAQQSLAAAIDVYVFPNEGQAASQQSMDEATCYDWAVQNTGTDPFDLEKQAQQIQQQEQQAHMPTGARLLEGLSTSPDSSHWSRMSSAWSVDTSRP